MLHVTSTIMGTSVAEETFARLLPMFPLRSWFYYALDANRAQEAPCYYEFGVGLGGTVTMYIDALKAFCRETKRNIHDCSIYLFDSFQGLPEKMDYRDEHPDWAQGSFSSSVKEIKNLLTRKGLRPDSSSIHFIEGFYERSLTSMLRDSLRSCPPTIVTVEVDYFSSTKTLLEWLRPLLHEGTLFYFDDIWAFGGDPKRGELAAIREFNEAGKGTLVPCHWFGHPSIWNRIFAYWRKENDHEES